MDTLKPIAYLYLRTFLPTLLKAFRYLLIPSFIVFVLSACVGTQVWTSKDKYALAFKSKKIKFNDVIFLKKNSTALEIEALSLGMSIATISILSKDQKICLNAICYKMEKFNRQYSA